MNKTFKLITLTIILITLSACSTTLNPPAVAVRPTTIQDPLLLEGWTALYSHEEAIQMPDGTILSGRDLAQFIIERAIPVLWASEDNNRHSSYSLQVCQGDVCTKENQPIYFSPALAAQETDPLPWLVECMAHEIYHEMQPFGQVVNSLFEEYSAYYISTQISQSEWAHFTGYQGLDPASLTQWFNDHNLMYAYQDLSLYPKKVLAVVKQAALANTSEVTTTDEVITFSDPSDLAELTKSTKRCIWIDSTGQQVCEP